MKSLIHVVALVIILAAGGPAIAQAPAAAAPEIEGLSIKIGDTVDRVKEVYQTPLDPEPYNTAATKGTSLRLKTKGVWFFFDRDGKIQTIRLEAPFKGRVNGVKIGDTVPQLLKTLGQPAKVPKPLAGLNNINLPRSYIYYLDDVTTANFQVNSDDEVEVVFLVK